MDDFGERVTEVSDEMLEEILSAWESPDSGMVGGVPYNQGDIRPSNADLARKIRSLMSGRNRGVNPMDPNETLRKLRDLLGSSEYDIDKLAARSVYAKICALEDAQELFVALDEWFLPTDWSIMK